MENAQTNANTETQTNGAEIDYKSEYQKLVAERDGLKVEVEKQKRIKDQYATENATYKKKAEAQMSDEEKRAKELQEALEGRQKLEAEIAQLKLEKELATNGFSAEETEKLIKGNFAVKDIADIITARCEAAVKSAKAEATKTSTASAILGNGTGSAAGNSEKSDYQKHQESKQTKSTIVEL